VGGKELPLVISHTASNSGILPQGASSSSKPMEEGKSKLVASKVDRLHLENTKLCEVLGGCLKRLG
jgi:hypothetical protein